MSIIFKRKSRLWYLTAGHPMVALAIVIVSMTPWHSAFAQDSEPDAKVTSCGNQISACGCTITSPGYYEISANLFSSQGLTALGDCIDIKASKVILESAYSITPTQFSIYSIVGPSGGAPTGIGVHILKGSSNDFIEESAVTGWDVGMMIEGNNNIIDTFIALSNGTIGVELNNAKNNTVSGVYTQTNTIGLELNNANNNRISDLLAYQNQNYGVWIRQSNNNQISGTFGNNKNIGLYVGCSDSGPVSATCKGVRNSKGNLIYATSSKTNGDYGIVIDFGNTQNLVTSSVSSGNSIDDFFDANGNCDQNKWLVNGFVSSDPSCIQ